MVGCARAEAITFGCKPSKLATGRAARCCPTLSLTCDGELLIGNAQEIVAVAECGIGAIRDNVTGLSGEVRVTAPAILVQSQLTDSIAQFLRAHPNVKISMDYSDSPRDSVAEGIDVAIRLGWLRDSSLKARKPYDVKGVVVVSRAHLSGRLLPKKQGNIEDWEWMDFAPVHTARVFRHKKEKSLTLH